MSLEIFLQRFDPSGDEIAKHPGVLGDLERVARKVLRESGQDDGDAIASDGSSVSIDLPGGAATVHPTFGQFPIQELDPLTLRMIFQIAKAGDMVIITEGGQYRAILTDAAQRSNLPEGWIGAHEAVPVCFSLEQLEHLLQDWYHKQTGYAKRAFEDVRSGGEASWIPGTRPAPPAEFIYVEARPEETATKQQKKLYKRYRDIYKAGGPHRPEKGMMTSEFWRLETPAGQAFYAYGYGGDYTNWVGLIRDFAAAEGRSIGRIENFDTFVLDDGQRFPLSACTCAKVKE